jgi:hypothetical protein
MKNIDIWVRSSQETHYVSATESSQLIYIYICLCVCMCVHIYGDTRGVVKALRYMSEGRGFEIR